MRIIPFTYLKPTSLDEASAQLAAHGAQAAILAGGTDLVPRMKQQVARPAFLIDLGAVAALRGIEPRPDGGVRIGATTALSDVLASPLIRQRYPALAEAALRVGSTQLRNAGTLGGNLCLETRCWYYNQSHTWKAARGTCYKAGGETCFVVNKPAECYGAYRGDTAIPLIAMGATIDLRGGSGTRSLSLENLYTGKGEASLALQPGEILTDVLLPPQPENSAQSYVKIFHRAVDFPLAGVAVSLSMAGGRCASARIALGAVASGPLRATRAEEILASAPLTDELIEEAAEAARKLARPVRNIPHGPPAYRRQMVGVALRRAVQSCVRQVTGGSEV